MGRKKAPKRPDLAKEMIITLMKRSLAIESNTERHVYAPWFKEIVANTNNEGMSYEELHELTGVPIKTLENFKASIALSNPKKKL
jgi:hypothetical protein